MKKSTGLKKRSNISGFTLVELLIVVIIVAVLAAIVVPQFSTSTLDAKEAALRSTLLEMRNAIELYYHQHNGRYPGHYSAGDGTTVSTVVIETDFLAQLTLYTDINGKTATTKDATTYKYGPYLKQTILPISTIDDSNTIVVVAYADGNAGDLTQPGAPAAGTKGWWFDTKSGKFIANNPDTSSDATTKYYEW